MRKILFSVLVAFGIGSIAFSQVDIDDSGGRLMQEQACYDVIYYDLTLSIDPEAKSIQGVLQVVAKFVQPYNWLVLDLDTLLTVEKIEELEVARDPVARRFSRKAGKLWIPLTRTCQAGEKVIMNIHYGGKPRIAPNPPWNGGFTWAKTPSGAHWIATTCQQNGADLWWPCKDHVSDEPDSMSLHIRVPDPLVVASNGRLIKKEQHAGGTTTYHWFISTPINIYNVALNIAPYRLIEDKITSVAGDIFPVVFYVLPEDYEKGKVLFPQILEHLAFFEKYFGPYPFRADKYGVAQTPHLGMEHQTIIAYGANFKNTSMTRGKDWGYDALHHHELSHEWWGNLVTNADWRDMWLHEGFGTYCQPLYAEYKWGKDAYHQQMASSRNFSNTRAIAPKEIMSAKEIYRAPIYAKGAWVLHTLRYLLGDESFFKAMRRMAYPDPSWEKITDGSHTRFASTDDFISICEEISGKDLEWFFDVYCRQPTLPVLEQRLEQGKLFLRWKTPGDMPFHMPVDVSVGGKVQRVTVTNTGAMVPIGAGEEPIVDPENWVLWEKE